MCTICNQIGGLPDKTSIWSQHWSGYVILKIQTLFATEDIKMTISGVTSDEKLSQNDISISVITLALDV